MMLPYSVLYAALLALTGSSLLASAKPMAAMSGDIFPFDYGKSVPSRSKNAKVANDDPVGLCPLTKLIDQPVIDCPAAAGDLHYICGAYSYQEATQACAAFGWRVAMVTEANSDDAASLVKLCEPGLNRIWVQGLNGQVGDPCAYILSYNTYAGVVFNAGIANCNAARYPVLCQDIPQATQTITRTLGEVVEYGTFTALHTTYVKDPIDRCRDGPNCRPPCDMNCTGPSCRPCAGGYHKADEAAKPKVVQAADAAQAAQAAQGINGVYHGEDYVLAWNDRCYGNDCPEVCSFKAGDIRLIKAETGALDAAAVCARYGWTLLDFTNGLASQVGYLFSNCQDPIPEDSSLVDGMFSAHIRSFNGIGSDCTTLDWDPDTQSAAVGFPLNYNWCTVDNQFWVLCQKNQPIETGQAIDMGSMSVSKTTLNLFPTLTVPTTTVTSTVTIAFAEKK